MNRAPTDFSSNADICEGYFVLQNLFSLFSFSLFYNISLAFILFVIIFNLCNPCNSF